MKAAIFSAHSYDRIYLKQANADAQHDLHFFTEELCAKTASLAQGFEVVSCFVVDDLTAPVLQRLVEGGTRLIALRSVGYDHVDLAAAADLGLTVVNVPTYSPTAVAEFAVLLLLALARQLRRAGRQFARNNYTLDDLMGVGVAGKTVGIIGTGNIGLSFARIMKGFGCRILASDPFPNPDLSSFGGTYVSQDELLANSDFISLHCPLSEDTRHLINAITLAKIQPHCLLINTARGPVVDTQAVVEALNQGQLAGYGMDVYEHEKGLFFVDHGGKPIQDALFNTLSEHPQVIVSGHQAFFTLDAVQNIARTTINNISRYVSGEVKNQVTA